MISSSRVEEESKKEKENIEENRNFVLSGRPSTAARLRDIIPQQRDLAIECI